MSTKIREVLLLLYRMVSFVLCVSVYGLAYFVGLVVGRWRNWVGVGTPEESVKEKKDGQTWWMN